MRLDEFGKPPSRQDGLTGNDKRFIDELVRRLRRKKVSISVNGPMRNIVNWGKGQADVKPGSRVEYRDSNGASEFENPHEFMDFFMKGPYSELPE